jgi:DNA gyrase/topoisomerase IV subunit B
MQDADVDGGHIRALHIGALHEINPKILESGMVYMANPPLYEVVLDEKSDKKKFIRTKLELIAFRVEGLYKPTLTLKLTGQAENTGVTVLKNSAFTDFCYIINMVGELFMELSNRLVIPPLILEKLTHVTGYIQPGKVNAQMLREIFGRGCYYSTALNILTIADGEKDVSFSLDGVADALYEQLMGILHRLGWKRLKILATTNFTDALQDTHISIVQLYQIFETLNSKLYVQRHKGLGGMEKDDLGPTCVHPKTRYLHQITSIGEYNRIRDLLGDDTTARKRILEHYGLLDPK